MSGSEPPTKPTDIRRRVVHGLKWTASVRLATQVFSWAVTILVIRFLSQEDYGLNAMVGVVVYCLFLFSTAGLQEALVQTKKLREEYVSQVFGILISLNGALCLGLMSLAPLVARYYREPRVSLLLIVLSASFLIVPFIAIPFALLSREMDFKRRSLADMVKAVTASVISLSLAVNGYGVWALVWGQVTAMLAQAIFLGVVRPWLVLPRFSVRGIETLFRFGGVVAVADVVEMLFWNADVFVGGRVLSTRLIGIYGVALTLAALPMQKLMPILKQIAFPAYAIIQDDPATISRYYLKSVRLVSLVVTPLLFGIAAVAEWGIPLLLGEGRWTEAIVPVSMLALIAPLRAIGTLNPPLLNGIGRARVNLTNAAITLVLMVPTFWAGAQFGVVGLSLSWLIMYPVVFSITSQRVLKVLRIPFHNLVTAAGPAFLGATAMIVSVKAVSQGLPAAAPPLIYLAILIPVGAATYLGVLVAFFRPRVLEVWSLVGRRQRTEEA